jgi:hypothetical protein
MKIIMNNPVLRFACAIFVLLNQVGCGVGEASQLSANNKFADSTNGAFVAGGSNNTAFGVNSLYELRTGNSNIGIGFEALYFNDVGNNNIGIGHDALYANKSGNYNVSIGSDSLRNNLDGSYNTAMNYDSLHNNKSGDFNTAIGYKSLFGNISGSYNIGLGAYAGSGYRADGSDDEPRTPNLINSNTTGAANIFIGNNTGAREGVNNSIAIGNRVVLTKSDSIILGSTTNKSILINGSLSLGGAELYGIRKIDINVQLQETASTSAVDIKIPNSLGTNEFMIVRPSSSLVGKSRYFSIVTTAENTNVLRVISILPESNASGIVSVLLLEAR